MRLCFLVRLLLFQVFFEVGLARWFLSRLLVMLTSEGVVDNKSGFVHVKMRRSATDLVLAFVVRIRWLRFDNFFVILDIFLCVHKFFILLQKTFFKLVISLRMLSH